MAEPWIRVHAMLSKKKVPLRLAPLCRNDVQKAMGVLITFWGNLSLHGDDGRVADVSDAQLEAWADWNGKRGGFAAWVRAEHTDAEGRINEWDEYAGALELRRMKERQRLAEKRQQTRKMLHNGTHAVDQHAARRTRNVDSAPHANVDETLRDVTKQEINSPTTARSRTEGEQELLRKAPDDRRAALGALFDGWVQGMGYADGKRRADPADLHTGCLEYLAGQSSPTFAPRQIMRWVQDAERRRTQPEPDRPRAERAKTFLEVE